MNIQKGLPVGGLSVYDDSEPTDAADRIEIISPLHNERPDALADYSCTVFRLLPRPRL